jgi:hypothetical protein
MPPPRRLSARILREQDQRSMRAKVISRFLSDGNPDTYCRSSTAELPKDRSPSGSVRKKSADEVAYKSDVEVWRFVSVEVDWLIKNGILRTSAGSKASRWSSTAANCVIANTETISAIAFWTSGRWSASCMEGDTSSPRTRGLTFLLRATHD